MKIVIRRTTLRTKKQDHGTRGCAGKRFSAWHHERLERKLYGLKSHEKFLARELSTELAELELV